MKIACIVSGQPRHLDKGLVELTNFLNGIEVDFFVHHWLDDTDFGKVFNSANTDKSVWSVGEKTKSICLDSLNPKKYLFEKQIEFKPTQKYESRSKTNQSPSDFMSMTYSRKKAFELLESYVLETETLYDFVISTRSDIKYSGPLLKDVIELFTSDTFYSLYEPGSQWNTDHLNDPFVISCLNNIKIYCSLFDNFEDLWTSGVDFCGHRLSMAQVKTGGDIKFDFIPQQIQWSYIRK
tara:strand:- start:249 stop:959 length:711 start_codon:yes stop_codon:yes gene_type:complete